MTSGTPGPIPIARTSDGDDKAVSDANAAGRSGSGSYLGLSASLGGSGSFKEAMAVSFGKDVADLLEYSIGRFSSSTDSDATIAPSSANRIESTFCRNFTCCGRALDDLHDLLQHYEECHVCFEDDEIPAMVADDEMDTQSSPGSDGTTPATNATTSAATSPTASPASRGAAELKRVRPLGAAVTAGPNTTSTPAAEDLDNSSAFDTAVMRSPSVNRGKKRAFTQSGGTSGVMGANQSLHRALVEGGIGRRVNMPGGVYSPSSPFSTPGNSRPGTPTIDSENEAFFGSAAQPSVFSNLSLRTNGVEEQQLPSCAPPNLFFPTSANNQPAASNRPAKRERFTTATTPTTTPGTPTTSASASSTAASTPADSPAAEHRPYKCPAPGCDKAYKQMNGLKYHRLHGHCNQNLRQVNNNELGAENTQESGSADASANKGSNGAAASLAGLAGASSTSASQGPDLRAFGIETTGSQASAGQRDTPSPSPSKSSSAAANAQPEKTYVCQVGNCDKRYKNLNGLRYHYLHSGSHGLLGLQLLHANGGGASAKADGVSGRPPVSTDTLSREQIVQAAAAAQALLNQQAQAQSAKNSSSSTSGLGSAPANPFAAAVSGGGASTSSLASASPMME